jgi:hypothetical protein
MTKSIVLYHYDELPSDEAKESARERAKELQSQEHNWASDS